jgi:hypothetical protein
MASIVSAGTTSATALNMSADTSGVLQLASNNGTVALTIEFVGINTTPTNVFHTLGANATGATTLADSVTVAKLRFQSASSSSLSLFQGTTGSGPAWYLQIANGAGSGTYPITLNPFGGSVGVGTAEPAGAFTVGGSGAVQQYLISTNAASQNNALISLCNSGAAYSLQVFDALSYQFFTSGTTRLGIASNGVLTSLATYNNVSGGSPNMFVQTDGTIYRGTSALKYKQDVRDLELIDINKFRAVRYKSKCELDDQTIDYFGVIADEVDAAGIKELVTYGSDGEVENFQYDRFTVVLLKAIQELSAKVTALENK